jgi:hypothetical protein
MPSRPFDGEQLTASGRLDGSCLHHSQTVCDDTPIPPSPFPSPMDGALAGSNDLAGLTVNASGANIPVIYGIRRVGTQVFAVNDHRAFPTDRKDVLYGIGKGEIEEITTIYLDSLDVANYATHVPVATKHTGAFTQTEDAHISGWTAHVEEYPGLAYCTLCYRFDTITWDHVPEITALVKGVKAVWDPRLSAGAGAFTTAATTNPALILADILANKDYGAGLPSTHHAPTDATDYINWTSVGTAATDCESLGVTFNGWFQRSASLRSVIDTLKLHGCLWVYLDGAQLTFKVDKSGSSVKTIDASVILPGSARWSFVDAMSQPNIVEVVYFDSSASYAESLYTARAASITEGSERTARYVLDGCTNATMAGVIANRILNHAVYGTIDMQCRCKISALALEKGDIVTLNSFNGLADGTLARVLSVKLNQDFTVELQMRKYSASIY